MVHHPRPQEVPRSLGNVRYRGEYESEWWSSEETTHAYPSCTTLGIVVHYTLMPSLAVILITLTSILADHQGHEGYFPQQSERDLGSDYLTCPPPYV